jgi:hypothetical protein
VTLTSPTHKPATAVLTPDDLKKGKVSLRLEAVPPPEPKKPEKVQQAVPETRTDVTMTGAYAFEILDASGRVIRQSASSHQWTVTGRPRLRVRSQEYFLDQYVQVDGGKTLAWAAPGLGRLQVFGRETCSVAVAGRNLGEPVIGPLPMAEGSYVADVTCGASQRHIPFSISADETYKLMVK